MINKNLLKILSEISKLKSENLGIFEDLNHFKLKILTLLSEKKELPNRYIFKDIETDISRAEKYRCYNELISRKLIKKIDKKTILNQ
jgi:hypothetical protein